MHLCFSIVSFSVPNIDLVTVCTETNISVDRWISRLGSCGWLQFISDMLTCAATVAQCAHCEGSAGLSSALFIVSFPLRLFSVCGKYTVCVSDRERREGSIGRKLENRRGLFLTPFWFIC